jgi:hypothetical protein
LPSPAGGEADASQIPAWGEANIREMAYLCDLEDGWYAITNPVRKVGFGVRFDPALFRTIWYWQELGAAAKGFPWWGRMHTTALEPWTSYPGMGLAEAVKNGSALLLQPGQVIETRLIALAYAGLEQVSRITPEGEAISGDKA